MSAEQLPECEVDRFVAIHGECHRAVIAQALYDAVRLPGFNPCNFNFGRYVATRILLQSITNQPHVSVP